MEPEPERERDEDLTPEVLWDRFAWSTDLLVYEDFEAVRAAREHYEPLMMKTLRDVASEPARYAQEARHHGHQCALAFLAEFRAAAAFPAILQFLAGIRGFEDALLPGDMIMDDLPPILVSTYDGNLDAMKTIIEDESSDELVRTATVAAMGMLVNNERVQRDDLSTCLGSLIQTLPRESSALWDEVVALALQFGLAEHRDAVEQLVASDVVDFLGPDEIAFAFDPESPPTVDLRKDLVDDAEELLSSWLEFDWGYGLQEDVPDEPDEGDDTDDDEYEGAAWDDDGDPGSVDEPGVPFVRETPKVGRNEPCPCGSGKKYKRCCEGK